MKIREYESKDYETCRRIIGNSTAQINEKYSDEELKHLQEVIPDMVVGFAEKEGFDFYIASKNGEIVGVAGYHLKGEVAGVFVSPDHQRQGIGERMMEEIEGKASDQGIQKLEVLSSLTAKKFYDKLGFQELKKKYTDMDGKDIPVYKMEKEL